MKRKQGGFVSIECIMSISIICIGIYIISTSLYSSYCFINYNKQQYQVINIAKSKIEDSKYDVKNSGFKVVENSHDVECENGYKIDTTIQKDRDYYQCYKINVGVSSKKHEIRLNSYATQ